MPRATPPPKRSSTCSPNWRHFVMAKKQVAVSLRKPPSPELLDAFVVAGVEPPVGEARPSPNRPRGRAAQPKQAEPAPQSDNLAPPESLVQAIEPNDCESDPPTEPVVVNAAVELTPVCPMVGPSSEPLRPVTIYLPQALA